ncbi:MAG TPA: antitoxin VapB family protein [Candidatus Bathyarchaeia archaeon]|nr:antitoxin VapB family protein [Candidatus Bathyarchaeia archaeon]
MAHKTLTISEEAYNALSRLKTRDESFTKVILRLARKKASGNILEYVRSIPMQERKELADSIEKALERRSSIRLRSTGR